ncbi:uncharacterized protein LOC132715894 [Ruditapes philippinarum]|uniref:uncharacterized protein LOC132715894 n=1 Tax=Ruditapes philippinarum TaxID=129788 RepID=UPI00295B0849|nr:uncharacterized protein LOC132715894 [Ruditapes philippinarum]XP_060554982.1 uncharacterized protein LOC132715894 [Ruditapes philippinarum]
MGNIITMLGDAFVKMKNAIIGFIRDIGVHIINIFIWILDAFWKIMRPFLVMCNDIIQQCRLSERRAITKVMAESAEVMIADLNQRLQDEEEISPERKNVISNYVDEYTKVIKGFAASA